MSRNESPATVSDEARWAEAQSILDRTPTESAEQRLRRYRRLVLLLVLAMILAIGAAATVVTILLHDSTSASESTDDAPTWQRLTGLGITGLSLVLTFGALVTTIRTNRRLGGLRSPVVALTRQQRKGLLAQVRGRAPVEAARLPLARYLAELLLSRRAVLVLNLGMVVMLVGQWIMIRSWFQLVFAGVIAVGTAMFWLIFRQDEKRARRFLDAHPASATDDSAP